MGLCHPVAHSCFRFCLFRSERDTFTLRGTLKRVDMHSWRSMFLLETDDCIFMHHPVRL